MRRILLASVALIAVACGSEAAGSDVATLTDDTAIQLATTTEEPEVDQEESLLEFTACVREQGIDIDDPEVDADGNVQLGLGQAFADSGVAQEDLQAAFEGCGDLIEGVVQQFQRTDQTELEDQLLAFAGCMRDEGIDMPDPDLSAFRGPGAGDGGGGGGPFGDLDTDDPAFQDAVDSCQDFLPNFGGGQGGGPGGGAAGGGRGGNGNG